MAITLLEGFPYMTLAEEEEGPKSNPINTLMQRNPLIGSPDNTVQVQQLVGSIIAKPK